MGFLTLQEAVNFLTIHLRGHQYEAIGRACARPIEGRVLGQLQAVDSVEGLPILCREQHFPEDSDYFDLRLQCVHLNFEKREASWYLREIWSKQD